MSLQGFSSRLFASRALSSTAATTYLTSGSSNVCDQPVNFTLSKPKMLKKDFFPKEPTVAPKPSSRAHMEAVYLSAKQSIQTIRTRYQQPERVFVNNEVHLADIEVYGFDYDYTLVNYETTVQELIYKMAIQELLNRFHYPAAIRDLPFDPSFVIRGLHFDIRRGFLFKLDAFHNIMLGTVYRGHQPVPDDQVISAYGGYHIAADRMEPYGTTRDIRQFIDLFAIPECCLVINILEYFKRNNLEVDPAHLFWDVSESVRNVHTNGTLHAAMCQDLSVYIGERCKKNIVDLLQRLYNNKKRLFLITNSPYMFVNKGMSYVVGPEWQTFFDVVICRARKPSFFVEQHGRPFRLFLPSSNTTSWRKVTRLERGSVYLGGNVKGFRELTGWSGGQVLYFGDHVFSDLADATQRHGWRTGAIVPELEREIMIANTAEYQKTVAWTLVLQEMIQRMARSCDGPDEKELLQAWRDERKQLRLFAKNIFNPRFGSVFRTYANPTYFGRRLGRYADIYTSHLANFLKYPLDFTFYPKRYALPHEAQILDFDANYVDLDNLLRPLS